jgi:hypothetical protein
MGSRLMERVRWSGQRYELSPSARTEGKCRGELEITVLCFRQSTWGRHQYPQSKRGTWLRSSVLQEKPKNCSQQTKEMVRSQQCSTDSLEEETQMKYWRKTLAKHTITEKEEMRHVLQSAQGCFDGNAAWQQHCNCSFKLQWLYSSV